MRRASFLAFPACLALAAQAPSAPPAAAPSTSPSLVRGFVKGDDGKPVQGAEVYLLRAADDDAPLAQARTDAEGYFLLETRERGVFRVLALSPSHKGVETLALLTGGKPLDFKATLVRFPFTGGQGYRVLGRIAGKPVGRETVLAAQADGTWAAELPAAPGEVWVGVLRGPSGAILPSRLDGTRLAGNGLLGVVKESGGKILIQADPKAYTTEDKESGLDPVGESPEARVLFRALEEAQRLSKPLFVALRDAARTSAPRPDAEPTLKALREASRKATPITRPVFLLSEASVQDLAGQPIARDLAHDIIASVGPASPAWSLFPSLPAKLARAAEPAEGRRFLLELLDRIQDAAVRRDVRFDLLESALASGDSEQAKALHAQLGAEWGANPRYAKALAALDPAKAKPAPAPQR